MHSVILNQGTGIPIVFLHGFLGTSHDWRSVVAHLSKRTCIAYDLPGHGQSPWTDLDICDLLADFLPPQSDLVGYSLGGRLALRFAMQHPERIRSLTLLSAHYGLQSEAEKAARLQADRIWAQKIVTLPFDQFLKSWYEQPVFTALKSEMASMRKYQRPNDLAHAMEAWSLGKQDYFGDLLRSFSCPWRVLVGAQDIRYSKLYADWPNVHSIPNAGHVLLLESPKEVAAFL